jgi:4-amino-4-deoxy-L-arabinose transferase-like glycosyltransferase
MAFPSSLTADRMRRERATSCRVYQRSCRGFARSYNPVTPHPQDRTGLPVLVATLVIVFVVLFWRLGAPSFWDPDEAHYAETTRELITTGDWLAPYYNDQPFFDKPILFHWLQAIPMAVAGPTELAARLIPALAALALVGVTAWVGSALLSADVGIVAALLLATSPAVFALARYAILDAVFTTFVFGGAGLVSVAAVGRRPRLQWSGYVLIALAVLTKGPVALVLCGLAFGVTILCSDEARHRLLELRLFGGVVLIAALASPWFVYMWARFRDAFVAGYLLDENIRLFATDRFAPTASSSVWFYVRVLGAGLLPWTALLAGRLYDDLRAAVRRDGSLDVVDVLLWSWTFAIVGFFTLSKFKLDHYVFPVAPTLCLICARAWVTLRQRPLDARTAGARVGLHLIGPLMVAAALAGGYVLIARLDLPRGALLVPVAMGMAGAAVTARLRLGGGRPPRLPWIVLGAMTIVYGGLVLWVLPALEQRKVVPDVARWVAQRAGESDRVASYQLNRWNTAFRFYVGRHVSTIEAQDEARALFNGSEPFYCAMLGPAYDEFAAQGIPLRIVYEREGLWATSGRVLWRRPGPSARFVVVTRVQR